MTERVRDHAVAHYLRTGVILPGAQARIAQYRAAQARRAER